MRSIYMLCLFWKPLWGNNGWCDGSGSLWRIRKFFFIQSSRMNQIFCIVSKKSQVIFLLMRQIFCRILTVDRSGRWFRGGWICQDQWKQISAKFWRSGIFGRDLMNVNFVLHCRRKDKSRLPLLLKNIIHRDVDADGKPSEDWWSLLQTVVPISKPMPIWNIHESDLPERQFPYDTGRGRWTEKCYTSSVNTMEERNQEYDDCRVMPKSRTDPEVLFFWELFPNPTVMAQLGIVESEQEL